MSEVKRYDHTNGGSISCNECYMDAHPMGDYVKSADYDAAQSELAALREELAKMTQDRDYCNRIAIHNKELGEDLEQRLADAERRNVSILEIARGLTIQLHAAIGNTELHEDCIRDLKDLEAADE